MLHKPVLLIGVGSSGMKVLEHVQNFHYENLDRNKPNYVEYLYIETNKENEPGITALPNEIRRVYISLGEMQTMIKELQEKYNDISWLPPTEHALEAGMGAGGIPACGRLALWGKNSENDNLSQVINAIQGMYQRVSGPGAKDSDGSMPAVFITGSVTGGTGSGAFIDLAYLVRRIIKGIKELYSLVLIPPKPKITTGNEIIYSNTLGALRALEHYNNGAVTYIAHDKPFEQFQEPPFDLIQIISQSYNSSNPDLQSLDGLYKMAGLYLFLNTMGLRGKRYERLVDASGNMQIGKYSTFGLSAIQYPKSQIQEYLSIELGSELLGRFIDPKTYYVHDNQYMIDRGEISRDISKRFGNILRGAFDAMNASAGMNVRQDIAKQAKSINSGQKGAPQDYLYELFSPGNRKGYYPTVQSNTQAGADFLIAGIHQLIVDDFNHHENLHYTKVQLEAVCDAITTVLNYWKSIGISSKVNNWENHLAGQVDWMLTKRGRWLLEQNNVLRDRMYTVLEQLKMHLFVRKLYDIWNNIKKEDIPYKTRLENTELHLPIMHDVNQAIQQIELALGTREADDNQRFKHLKLRLSEIESDMRDETLPILRIFNAGTFQREVDQARLRYNQESNRTAPSKEVLVEDGDLWSYLFRSDTGIKKLHRKLYGDVILNFRQELERVDAVGDYDVSKYVDTHQAAARQYAAKSKFFLLPVSNRTLEDAHNIPKVVIGSNRNVIEKVIGSLRDNGVNDFDFNPDHILEMQELKNIMVFYIERANFYPLQDIDYIAEIDQIDKTYYKRRNGLDWKKWYTFRNPYLNTGEIPEEPAVN